MRPKTLPILLAAAFLGAPGILAQSLPGPPLVPDGEVFADAGGLLQEVRWVSPVYAVAWSFDGGSLATGSGDGVVRLWDPTSGKERSRFQDQAGFRDRSEAVRSVALSPDGVRIAAAYKDGLVRVWDTAAKGEPQRLRGWAVAWSDEGRFLATGLRNGAVHVWDAASGDEAFSIPGAHTRPVSVLAWNGENLLASGSWDSTIRISDGRDGSLIRLLEGHEEQVNAVAWSPDGKSLASASTDGTARVWEVETGVETYRFEIPEGAMLAVAWSVDGDQLVTGSSDRSIRIWDVRHGAGEVGRFPGHRGDVYALAFSPGGERLASGSADGSAKIWSAGSRREILRLQGHASRVLALALSRDGRTLAVGSEDDRLRVWTLGSSGDAQGGTPVQLSLEGDKDLLSVAVSPDGKLVAAGFHDGTVEIWEEGRIRYSVREHVGSVFCLAFDSAGERLVSGTDRDFLVWDIASQKISFRKESPRGVPSAFAWSPNGERLAVGSRDGKVQLYEVSSLEATKVPKELDKSPEEVKGLAFPTLDEVWALLRDGTLYRWNWKSGRVDQLDRFSARMSSVALSLDGRILASVTAGERIVRVATRGAESYEPDHELVGGERGTWVACTGGRCWRHDDGTLLLVEDEKGELSPVPPAGAMEDPRLEVEVPVTLLDSKEGEGVSFAVKIHNVGHLPVFWLRLQRKAASADDSLIFHPSPTWTKLDPGEKAELSCWVSIRSKLTGKEGRKASLPLELMGAGGRIRALDPISVVLPRPSSALGRGLSLVVLVVVLGSGLLLWVFGKRRRDRIHRLKQRERWMDLAENDGEDSWVESSSRSESITETIVPKVVADRFNVIGTIAHGGMGKISLAYDTVLHRDVALKALLAKVDDEVREQFEREARLLAKLRHPCIVVVYDLVHESGNPYIVMERVVGESLNHIMKKDLGTCRSRLKEIFFDIGAALTLIHENDIVHRDVKPSNVMIMPNERAKVVDFGIARFQAQNKRTKKIEGTRLYMAPERWLGEIGDQRVDIYSLGVMLYEIATGQLPFKNHLQQIHQDPVTPPEKLNPCVVPEFSKLILDCIEFDKEMRPQSVSEVISRLETIDPLWAEDP